MAKSLEEILIHEIIERQKSLSDSILSNPVPNYETYLRLCGEYAGLEFAHNTLRNILKENDDGDV